MMEHVLDRHVRAAAYYKTIGDTDRARLHQAVANDIRRLLYPPPPPWCDLKAPFTYTKDSP